MNRPQLACGTVVLAAIGAAGLLTACRSASDDRPAAAPAASATTVSALTVEVVSPSRSDLAQALRVSGPLVAWQEVIVSPETGGLRLSDLRVDVGAKVARGQELARLADESVVDELHKQQAGVQQAQVAVDQAASNTRRAKLVEDTGGLSAQKIEEYRLTEASDRAALASAQADLEAAQLKLRQTRIVAPDDGVVATRTAILGNVVAAGTELFRLVRQGRVEWRPELDARQAAQARAGQRARVELPTGETVEGRVRIVAPALSTTTGRATIYVSLPVDSAARVGMFAGGSVDLGLKPALTLPESALVQRDGRTYVYTVDAGRRVHAVVVATGAHQGGRVEIASGLPADAHVVASGGGFLSEGVQVDVARSTR